MTTRRHPRTLEEAFGPHTSRHVYEPAPSRSGEVLYFVVVLACIVSIGVMLAWRG